MTRTDDTDAGGPRERIVRGQSYTARSPVNTTRGTKFRRVLGPDGTARWAAPDGTVLTAIKEKLSGGRFEYIKPAPGTSARAPGSKTENEEPAASPEAIEAAKHMDRKTALDLIGKVVKTKNATGPLTILIWAGQSHVISLLESVFYLGLRGPTGSGKGTGVEAAVALSPNGEVLGTTTDAYLASVLDEGRAVGL